MAYTPEQRRNIALAKRLSAGHAPRVRLALLEAMGVESNFRNLNYGDRDSMGVLQQRRQYYPNSGKNVAYDIQQFLSRADRANKQMGGSAGQLAQAVQRSAFPSRYDERGSQAKQLLGGSLGSGGSSGGLGLVSRLGGAQAANGGPTGGYKQQVAAYLLQQSSMLAAGQQMDPSAILGLVAERQAAEAPSATGQELAGRVAQRGGQIRAGKGSGINELFYDPLGAIKHDQSIAPIGGHSDHVHVALNTLGAQLAAERKARQMGLHVGEEQDSDTHQVHVSDSNHYKRFGHTKWRRASDVSGQSPRMAAFYRWVQRNY